jgi:hypothetical protein
MSLQLLAKQMEAKGRGGDSVLVHMTPGEVEGLQKLAEAAGGTLTVNPETGLVEANFLKRLLPTLAGGIASMYLGPAGGAAVGALVGGVQAERNDQDVGMGALLGGLGGYGGASIASGFGAGAAANAANAGTGLASTSPAAVGQTIAQPGMAVSTVPGSQAAMLSGQNALGTVAPGSLGSSVATYGSAANPAIAAQTAAAPTAAKIGMSDVAMATAPTLAPGKRPGDTPADDEMYVYDFDYNPTGADRMAGGTSSERTYFNPEFSNRRKVRAADYFSAAEGGEVADAAPVDAGIAGGMSGASKAAYDYLMGSATSSAPQGIAAPAMVASKAEPAQVEARSDRMYSFNPATGAFTKNPNYRDPNIASGIPGVIGMALGNASDGGGYDVGGYGGYNDGSGGLSAGSVAASLGDAGYSDTGGYGEGPGGFGGDTGHNGADSDGAGGDWAKGGLLSLAKGGMKSGGFVIPADVVSMVGEGNTDAGYKRIKAMVPGATAIKGKDGGQADTVKTSIEGKQPARVAHGEMYIPPETVKRMGGAKKLYAMMDRVRAQATGSKKQIRPVSLKKALA